jgi:Universal stress protein family
MSNVLLVVPLGVEPRRARDYAIEQARRLRGDLIGLIVLDPAETARVASSLDSAFMGDRVSDRLVEVLAHEAHGRAEAILHAIHDEATKQGVSFTSLVEEGEPSEVCARVVRKHAVALTVLVAEKRSWLTRFLSGATEVHLPMMPGCEVRVMEED